MKGINSPQSHLLKGKCAMTDCGSASDCDIIDANCNTKEDIVTSLITARVDARKRKAAEKVFSEVGLTTSAAVNLFICAVAMHGGIPFQIGVRMAQHAASSAAHPAGERRSGLKLGKFADQFKLPPDFDSKFDALDEEVAALFA